MGTFFKPIGTIIAPFQGTDKDTSLEAKLSSINPTVRAQACLELAEKQGVKAQQRVEKIAKTDASEKVRAAAVNALAKTDHWGAKHILNYKP